MDERKRDSMVANLRRRMAEVGIELNDLAAAIAEDEIKEAARYRSATGDTWSGDGEMPQWLKQAISACATRSCARTLRRFRSLRA
ncbi:hypothetical protein Bphy_6195 (plasmid) [Paraburkholderia phymatum STM815]|uniref:DNA-binding protein H-NS-like C-terminal domain-containing protein n=1 Tax=Paraburkholderia phymatum (strain DSM 17167 / CIP 108236 / LMG 21445 / STM815) TaxID=391038 RepID=B2JWB5_PARP8|nr:hypothetical protein Bphy_6195 [Paraburkholderia phymatum STM815]